MTKDDVCLVTRGGNKTLNPIYVESVEIYAWSNGPVGGLRHRVRAHVRGGRAVDLTETFTDYEEALVIFKRASAILTSPNSAIWLEDEKEEEDAERPF